jgi:hypothetical protein
MRHTSGIIINDDIFINSSHVVKIEKTKKADSEYTITIHLSESSMSSVMPVVLTFVDDKDKNGKIIAPAESKCNEAFKKIIIEMYSTNYAIVNVPSVTK